MCVQQGSSEPSLNHPQMPVDFGLRHRPGSAVWQSHLPIPPELRHLYGGKRVLRKTLNTRDRAEAERRARARCLEVYERFDRQLRELNPTRVESLSPAMQAALLVAIRHDILDRDDVARFDLPGGPALRAFWEASGYAQREAEGGQTLAESLAEVHAAIADGLGEALATGDLLVAEQFAEDAARKFLGVSVEWSRLENQRLLVQCLRTAVAAWRDRVQRDRGAEVETPEAPRAPSDLAEVTKPEPRLRDILGPWKASDPGRNPKYLKAMERNVATYEAVTGNPPLARLTRAQGDDFRAYLLEVHEEPKTASDKLNAIKTLLNYAAIERGLIDRNPWVRLSIKFAKGGKRTPWTGEEIRKLFGSPMFRAYALPTAESAGMDAAYWVPLMVLFSGARVSELCQLRVADILFEDGPEGPSTVPVFRVTRAKANAAAGTLATKAKTDGSVRLIPIHRELIRLGFLDYVDAIKGMGAGQLFPAIKRYDDETGEGAGSALSTWFGEYRRAVGVDRDLAGLHAARHTMRTALHRRAGASDKQAFVIGGWTAPGVRSAGNDIYLHEDTSPATLQTLINRVDFEGLDLPRVYVRPGWTPSRAQGTTLGARSTTSPQPEAARSRSGRKSKAAATKSIPPQLRASGGASNVGRA